MMDTLISSRKTHGLNNSERFVQIVPALLLMAMLSITLIFHWDNDGLTGIVIVGLILYCILVGFAFFSVLLNRLITTPQGIEYYFLFPFHSFIPWSAVKRIEQGALFGVVNLIYEPTKNSTIYKVIHISSYIDNWQDSELISEIQKYAPHIIFPDELLNRKPTKFYYRSGTLLIYYLLSLFLLFLLRSFLPANIYEQYNMLLQNGAFGLIWSIMGGAAGLLLFGEWRDRELNADKIRKVAILFYITPFSGYTMIFVLSWFIQTIPLLNKLFEPFTDYVIMPLGLLQIWILFQVFRKYIASS